MILWGVLIRRGVLIIRGFTVYDMYACVMPVNQPRYRLLDATPLIKKP